MPKGSVVEIISAVFGGFAASAVIAKGIHWLYVRWRDGPKRLVGVLKRIATRSVDDETREYAIAELGKLDSSTRLAMLNTLKIKYIESGDVTACLALDSFLVLVDARVQQQDSLSHGMPILPHPIVEATSHHMVELADQPIELPSWTQPLEEAEASHPQEIQFIEEDFAPEDFAPEDFAPEDFAPEDFSPEDFARWLTTLPEPNPGSATQATDEGIVMTLTPAHHTGRANAERNGPHLRHRAAPRTWRCENCRAANSELSKLSCPSCGQRRRR